MEKILKKLKNFGFIKGEHQLLNQDEVEKLKINIEKVLGKKDFTKYPFFELCGHNSELDNFIEKLLSDKIVENLLTKILGKNYILWGGGSVRISTKEDKGLYLHQDAPGEVGLIFLVNDQPKSSTVMLKGSHFFPRISEKLSWNSPKIFYYLKLLLSPLIGKAGDHYIWFYKTWHGRLPNKTNEKCISLFFPFFPQGTDKLQMLKECNEKRVNKISSPYIKKLLNNYSLSAKDQSYEKLECMQIEKFKFKNIFNTIFIICFLKNLILELIFFPIRFFRILKKND